MSPVQVTCLIEQHLEEVVTYTPDGAIGEFTSILPVYFRLTSDGPIWYVLGAANYSMDFLSVDMFSLKINKIGDGDIGDSAIVSLDINSAAINYHDAFT